MIECLWVTVNGLGWVAKVEAFLAKRVRVVRRDEFAERIRIANANRRDPRGNVCQVVDRAESDSELAALADVSGFALAADALQCLLVALSELSVVEDIERWPHLLIHGVFENLVLWLLESFSHKEKFHCLCTCII